MERGVCKSAKAFRQSYIKMNSAERRKDFIIVMVEASENKLEIFHIPAHSEQLSSRPLARHMLCVKASKTSQDHTLCQETCGSEAVKLTTQRKPSGHHLNDSQDSREAVTFWPHCQSKTLPEALIIFVKLPAE